MTEAGALQQQKATVQRFQIYPHSGKKIFQEAISGTERTYYYSGDYRGRESFNLALSNT